MSVLLHTNIVAQYEDITNAYEVIRGKAKSFSANVPLPSIESFKLDGTNSEVVITSRSSGIWLSPIITYSSTGADLKKELNAYLQDLEESQVRTLQDIIDFNNEHATEELPPRRPLFPMIALSASSKAHICSRSPKARRVLGSARATDFTRGVRKASGAPSPRRYCERH